MKKIYLAAALALSASAHAGFYVGGNVGFQNINVKTSTKDVSSTAGGVTDRGNPIAFSAEGNSLLAGLIAGYDYSLNNMTIGGELSFDMSNFSKEKNVDTSVDAVTRGVVAAVPANKVLTVKVKSNYGFGFMPKIMFSVTQKVMLGFGLKLNWTEFSVHAINKNEASNWRGAQRKKVLGYEPTLLVSYKMTDKLAVRFSAAAAFYNAYKTPELTIEQSTDLYLNIKPRTYNAKVGLVYSF